MITTSKLAKKLKISELNQLIYFSIDYEDPPYKGVKGKGIATLVEDPDKTVSQGDRISMKYLRTLGHPIAKMTSDGSNGDNVVIEISPKFFLHGTMVKCSYDLYQDIIH